MSKFMLNFLNAALLIVYKIYPLRLLLSITISHQAVLQGDLVQLFNVRGRCDADTKQWPF